MPVVCFLSAVAFFPWFVAPSNTAKLILLSILIPVFVYRSPQLKLTRPMVIGGAFLAWTAATLLWGPLLDGVGRLWWWMLGAGAFVIGAGIRNPDKCLIGFALGVAVNALVAVAQALGWDVLAMGYFGWEPLFVTAPRAGLMVNGNYLAEAGLMAFAAMVAMRKWWLAALCLVATVLPVSRGAFVALGIIAVVFAYRRWGSSLRLTLAVLIVFIGGFDAYLIIGEPSVHQYMPRITLYANSLAMVTPWGHGAGSYWSTFPLYHDAWVESFKSVYGFGIRPRTAHNDLLTIAVETGLIGLALFAWFLTSCLKGRAGPGLYLVAAFLALGLFNSPMFIPPTSFFMAALALGHLSKDPHNAYLVPVFRDVLRRHGSAWRALFR
ncbi:MAG: O-antigen ligase family protein [Proteobacteria bacterium]|nr:O-antigen ligase family protein [Pseudomonadota bacterium]